MDGQLERASEQVDVLRLANESKPTKKKSVQLEMMMRRQKLAEEDFSILFVPKFVNYGSAKLMDYRYHIGIMQSAAINNCFAKNLENLYQVQDELAQRLSELRALDSVYAKPLLTIYKAVKFQVEGMTAQLNGFEDEAYGLFNQAKMALALGFDGPIFIPYIPIVAVDYTVSER